LAFLGGLTGYVQIFSCLSLLIKLLRNLSLVDLYLGFTISDMHRTWCSVDGFITYWRIEEYHN